MFIHLLLILNVLFASHNLFSSSSVSVFLDRKTVTVGEEALLTIEITGDSSEQPAIPNIEHLEISNRGTSSNFSWINGKSSKSTNYTYSVRPSKEGKFEIPSFDIDVNGKIFSTRKLLLTVKAASDRGFISEEDSEHDQNPIAFIKRTFSKEAVILGEPIIATTKLYYKHSLSEANVIGGKSQDFRYIDIKQETDKEIINNERYNVILLRSVMIPLTSGTIEVPRFSVNLGMVIPQRANNRQKHRGFFSEFFSDFNNKVVNRTISSDTKNLQVDPIPLKDRPQEYIDLVGRYNMFAELSHRKLKQGETTTLTIKIRGQGAMDGMKKLDLDLPKEIKIYEDKPEITEKIDLSKGLISEKTIKFALVPTAYGEINLGELKFYYFSSEEKIFKPLYVSLGSIEVERVNNESAFIASSNELSSNHKNNFNVLASDLIDIHRTILLSRQPNFIDSPLFYLSLAAFFLASIYLLMYLYLKLRSKSSFVSARTRRSQAFKRYLEKTKPLDLNTDNYSLVLSKNFVFFREYIGDKFNVNGNTLTSKEIDNYLSDSSFQPSIKEQLVRIYKVFDEMSFGRVELKFETVKTMCANIDEIVKEIEKNA